MSRVYFHSPSGEAELWGGERAWLGGLVSDMAMGFLSLDHSGDRIRELIKPGHYLLGANYQGPGNFLAWRKAVETSLSVGTGTLAWNGRDIDEFSLMLNTAAKVGNDAVKLAARIHGQCEIHCYVEAIDREWLAQVIGQGLDAGLFRDLAGYDHAPGWDGVTKFLRARDDEPVVMSYSVCDSFPSQSAAAWEPPEDPDWIPEWYRDHPDDWASLGEDGREDAKSDYGSERWHELPRDEQWRIAMEALRSAPGHLRLDPAEWSDFAFGHGLSVLDIVAEDYRDRLDRKLPVAVSAA